MNWNNWLYADRLGEEKQTPKPQTNADRIRAMSDDELIDFLDHIACAGESVWSEPFKREICDNCKTKECNIVVPGEKIGICPHGSDLIWWLKQLAEGE